MINHNLNYISKTGMDNNTHDIIVAALDGNAKLVGELLESGVDINTADPDRGFTCLHIAALQGDEALLDVLLEHHRQHNDIDFTLRTYNPPLLAWQLAMSFLHYDVGNRIDRAGGYGTPSRDVSAPRPA